MNIAYPNGSTIVDYPLLEHEVVSSLAQRLVIDQGAIKIDSAHHNLDQAHLVLDGVLSQGQDYFKITKQGTTLLRADHTGKLLLENMQAHVIEVEDDVALYGDATLTYTPQDANTGVNVVPPYTYRFGANSGDVGDYTNRGDGLEMKEPDDAATGDRKNKILIQVNSGTPTIELLSNKVAGEPDFLIRNKTLQQVLSLDSTGVHLRCDEKASVYITPGTPLTVATLTDGKQVHWFELSVPWTAANPDAEIEIEQAVAISGFSTIENLEVYLDDEIQVNEIQSRVYIKRWGVYRFSKQKLWIVLGLELRNNETSLVSGAFIRLTFNNKKVLT